MIEKAREALKLGITEIHIVGGLHPSFKWDYYIEMLRSLKALDPNLHLKAFTAIEILHLSWVGKRSVPETLAALREAGLGSLTGGGAEILDPEVRQVICHAKESAEEWLDVHRTWHKMGGRSTCTMLIGHVETNHHRVDHLRRLRELQHETGGFTAFVPLAFHPENTKLPNLPGPSGYDMLKTLAIARIYLAGVVEPWRRRHGRDRDRGEDLPYGWRQDAAGNGLRRIGEGDSRNRPGTGATGQFVPPGDPQE
jgi:aminodeoxyfutalosine synthase